MIYIESLLNKTSITIFQNRKLGTCMMHACYKYLKSVNFMKLQTLMTQCLKNIQLHNFLNYLHIYGYINISIF